MKQRPTPLLETVLEERTLKPPVFGLCAGYETESWRAEQLAEYLVEWLPDFALSESELMDLGPASARRALRNAAATIYRTDKYAKRGEFGELLLHAVLREHFQTLPAIRKIFFKDNPNDVVKGFDAVHVVATDADLELWLGEVKFYSDIDSAIRDVLIELENHSKSNYLRDEFLLILNKVDATFPHADALRKLLDPTTSLDAVFARARFPVLLTYDSETTLRHKMTSQLYRDEIAAELRAAHSRFARKGWPRTLIVSLILIPLAKKSDLVSALHAKLRGQQA